MMIREQIRKTIAQSAELNEVDVVLEYPVDDKFGDYSTNVAMRLAKEQKKNPMEIAENLKSQISQSAKKLESIEKIEVASPGYINFYLSNQYLQGKVAQINEQNEKLGDLTLRQACLPVGRAQGKKIMVEYSQPNTHKEFHIGHLRNVFIGSALVEVLRKARYEVISANYIGDTGSHIAKCLWGIQKFHARENIDDVKNKAEFLGKAYAEAVQAIEENPEYEKEFKDLQNKFDQNDSELQALWQTTRQWSLDEFEAIYKLLSVHFDVYFFESEEELAGKKMVDELLGKKVVEQSEGAIVANLEKYGLGVLVLVRKDGSALYGLKDIPLAIKKFKDFGINTSIYIVDMRQSLYFDQLFKILELCGFTEKMVHIGYEFVALKGGESMSSRKGNIITARELIDEINKRVKEKFPDSPDSMSIALGALKFSMLKYSANRKIEFDINESIRLEGDTGPYVQYAYARICSILAKANLKSLPHINPKVLVRGQISNLEQNLELLIKPSELALIRELIRFPEVVADTARDYQIQRLPNYAVKVAAAFHRFYDTCQIIGEEEKLMQSRLALAKATQVVLKSTLGLLGVNAPERM